MKYQSFVDSFSKVKEIPLPGKKAQLLAAPLSRIREMPSESVYLKAAKQAAVLLYCYPKEGQMHLSLIKRTEYEGVHSGQISFPGGKKEKSDQSLQQTAIRECNEELGTQINENKKLISLTPLYIPPSNFLVTPFLAYESFCPKFTPDHREVAIHIEIPLFKILELKIEQHRFEPSLGKEIQVPCFAYQNYFIWGATAMILSEFKVFLALLRSN